MISEDRSIRTNRGKARINRAGIGYWWSIVGHFGPGVNGWRPTKKGAIKKARKVKARLEEHSRQYHNPDWLID